MANPPFVLQHISNHGAGDPINARLLLQTHDLVAVLALNEKARQSVMDIYYAASKRLLLCSNVFGRVIAERDRAIAHYIANAAQNRIAIPYALNLDNEAETFLLNAKHYLRELVNGVNLLFGAKLKPDASVLWDAKNPGSSEIVKWSVKEFGTDHRLTMMLAEEDEWISEIVKMRNAGEHPGGLSGTLKVENYRPVNGGIAPPVWYREGRTEPSDIYQDMGVMIENMLTLGEDLVAEAVRERAATKALTVAEIPLDKRDPAIPKRYKITFAPGFLPPFPE